MNDTILIRNLQHVHNNVNEITKSLIEMFSDYHRAVAAERYRVTSIRVDLNGCQKAFILDKQNGVTRGFNSLEIKQRTKEIQRLNMRGEHIYFTPLSDKKHHILIDDLDLEKLRRLIQSGYKPAVLLESSPKNYQAVITLPKLGSPYDKAIGNRITERLNREYGDPKLSGCIHPHRAPGYENKKLKHKQENGTYPTVLLLKAEHRECSRTLELSEQINDQYQKQNLKVATTNYEKLLDEDELSLPAMTIYQNHFKDIHNRQVSKGLHAIDLSRIDSMIAIRMRVTGHTKSVITKTISLCAPIARLKKETRNWNDYTERTVNYAFSNAGDKQVIFLNKYCDHWKKLEGSCTICNKKENSME